MSKLINKANELRDLGVVLSHANMKAVGFGSDSVQRFFRWVDEQEQES